MKNRSVLIFINNGNRFRDIDLKIETINIVFSVNIIIKNKF